MKRKIIEGRCYKERTKRGLFRMKKKSREDLEMDRYMKTLAYIDSEDDYCIYLMGKATEEILREKGEQLAAERRPVVYKPEANPAVWLSREYGDRFFAL
jgi:hypothetical protein